MSTEVERGGGPQTIFSCSVCSSAGVTVLMKWKTYCSKINFVYDKKYAHKIHSLNQERLPPSLCLPHSQDKVARIFTYQNWTVGESGNELLDHSLWCSPLRQHSNLTTYTAMQFHLVGEMVTCCYSFRALTKLWKDTTSQQQRLHDITCQDVAHGVYIHRNHHPSGRSSRCVYTPQSSPVRT